MNTWCENVVICVMIVIYLSESETIAADQAASAVEGDRETERAKEATQLYRPRYETASRGRHSSISSLNGKITVVGKSVTVSPVHQSPLLHKVLKRQRFERARNFCAKSVPVSFC